MKTIAVITDPAQVLKILMHLVKTQRPPRSGSHLPPLIAPLPPAGGLSLLLHRNATAPAGGVPRPAARPDTPLLYALGR